MKKVLFSVCLILNFCLQGQVTPVCFNGSPYSAAPITTNVSNITSGDFNGDGLEDLASSNPGVNNISVFIGTGYGNFLAASNYTTGYYPKLIKSSDFNGDGILDLVFCSGNPSKISILFGSGVGAFSTTTQYTITPNTLNFSVGDFNNDGKPDLATLNSVDTKVKILLNDGIGGFLTPVDYILGYAGSRITINDFNSDGSTDLLVMGNGYLNYLKGSPTGTFTPNSVGSISNQAASITSADFNNDGSKDFAISDGTSNLSVYLNNNLGFFSFSTVSVSLSKPVGYIKAVDLNGDNIIDIISGPNSSSSPEVTVLLGTGTGSFSVNDTCYTGVGTSNIETKDFNNDGLVDLVLNNNGYISLLLGSGSGNFTSNNFALDGALAAPFKSIASADFNTDGINDLVVTNSGANTLSILIGLGAGQFSAIVNYTVGLYPESVATGDFNGDSKIDLVVTNIGSDDASVLLGTGTGSFSAAVSYLSALDPKAITVNDFNGDGYSDFAFVCSTGNSIFIRSGNASGTLPSGGGYSVGNNPVSINSGDFNGDGKIDLVVANYNNNAVSVLMNNGSGSFLAPVIYSTGVPGAVLNYVLTGDFNGDTKIDLAVSNSNASKVSIFNGTGSGTFLPAVSYIVGSDPFSIIKDDYNNDGRLDLLVAHSTSTFFSVLMSTVSGTFSPAISYPIGQTQGAVCSTDLNGDGKKDIVIENRVFINSTPTLVLSSANSICLGNSIVINVSNLGFSTYSWSTGAITSSISVSPTITSTYSLTATTSGGCMSTAIKTISVSTISPTVSIIGTNTICINSSSTFTSTGASTYTWSNGALTTSVVFSPTTTTNYSVVGTNSLGCSSTETLSVIVDNTCQDVWPGDANSDGLADNLDVLELGLHYTQIGAPRSSTNNTWQSYFANNWVGTITNGKNLNHSDCNGDGTIDANDTLAIYNNYGLTHTFKPAQTNTVNPQLSIVPDQPSVAKGTWGTASIYLGDATTSINNINGIAFTVDFDKTLIESNSIYLEYQNSFIDVGQNLHFQKLDFASGKLFTATTHTLSNNVSGFGKIATLHYQILSSLASDQVLNIGLSQANQSDASGVISPLTSGTGTLMAIGASVGIKETSINGNVFISPNPTNGLLNVNFSSLLQNTKIELYNSIGALVLTEAMSNKNNAINMSNFSSGIYFMKVIEVNKVIAVKKVVKE